MKAPKFISIILFFVLSLASKAQNTFPTCVGCNVGIGTVTPGYPLEVVSGDINLFTLTNGYRIGGSGGSPSNYVLRHNGQT